MISRLRTFHALVARALTVLALSTACATTPENESAELVLMPWNGPAGAFPQDQGAVVDVMFEPPVTYAVFVPMGKTLYVETSHAERWFLWLRGLTDPFSAVVYGGERATFVGPEVILLSVSYINGHEHSPFFGRVMHVEDAPKLSGPAKSLRAIWEQRGDVQENLVVLMSLR